MMFYAAYHIDTEKEVLQPVEICLDSEIDVKDLNGAKEKVDEICENHEDMSYWYKSDPTSKWEDGPFDYDEGLFARRIFEENTQYPEPKPRKAIVEIREYLIQS